MPADRPLRRRLLLGLSLTAIAVGWAGFEANRGNGPTQPPPQAHAVAADSGAPSVIAPAPDAATESADAGADAGLDAKAAPPTEVGEVHLRLPDAAEPGRRKEASATLRARAAEFFKKKQYQKALPLFELGVRLDPDSPEGAERLGATYARTGDSIRAVYFYNRFLELAPTDPLANALREDVDAWLKENPDPALQLMREGTLRPLTQAEADLQSELGRRLVDTTNPEADLDWFEGALADLRAAQDAGG